MTQQSLIQHLRDVAAEVYKDNPLMQQVSLTQAILESGLQDGIPSKLAAAPNYNLFGIKATDAEIQSDGDIVVNFKTTEYINGKKITVNAYFRKFTDYEGSFEWHKRLMGKPRYKRVMASQSPSEAFNMLYKSGYATDVQYSQKLLAIYNQYVKPLTS